MFAGMDYLTLWSDSSPDANKTFYEQARNWLIANTVVSQDIKQATLYGTKGIRANGIYIGTGDERALLNVPGSMAQQAYCELYNPSHKVTRIDVQVTSTHGYDRQEPTKPLWAYKEKLKAHKPIGKGRKPKTTYAGSDDDGLTIYSGSFESGVFGRIYDKWLHKRQEEYKYMHRWEVIARHEYAEMLASRFLMMTYDEITSQVPELVASFWQKRGVIPPWGMTHSRLWRQPPKQPWDYERSLSWLASAVAPTIERLTGYVPLSTILASLGIDSGSARLYTTGSGGMGFIPLNMDGE